jgi:hypothetical protein
MWSSLVAIAALFYLSIRSLSGHYTFADIGIKVLGDFKLSEAFGYLFGVGGAGYGLRERKLRRQTTERFAARNFSLEKQIDPNRSSSRLTTRGTTNPEDRI